MNRKPGRRPRASAATLTVLVRAANLGAGLQRPQSPPAREGQGPEQVVRTGMTAGPRPVYLGEIR